MAYKIVTKNRYGILVFYHEQKMKTSVQSLLKKYPFLETILPKYEIGKWIHSFKKSPGIFCFKTKKDAKIYLNKYFLNSDKDKLMIIKVLGKNKQLCSYRLSTIDAIVLFHNLLKPDFIFNNKFDCIEIEENIVLYEKVKVLE